MIMLPASRAVYRTQNSIPKDLHACLINNACSYVVLAHNVKTRKAKIENEGRKSCTLKVAN
jgi:hypothetical protein